jgi:hypothetical protein
MKYAFTVEALIGIALLTAVVLAAAQVAQKFSVVIAVLP